MAYKSINRVDLVRRWNLQFLAEVSEFIPPLKDPSFGVQTDASHFSDYVLHLTPEGARLRSAELAVQIKAWDVWTHNELRTAVQAR